jgi:hypothetical protein
MAVVVIGQIPGGSAEMDRQMLQAIGVSPGSVPSGALARMAGPVEGGYQIISVWDSSDAWETFQKESLEPFFKQAGRGMPASQVLPLDMFMTAGA